MQLALPALGAVAGWATGIAGAASWGWMAGSLLYALTSGPRKGRPQIHETGAQTVQEGAPINIVYGTAPVTGNVIAAGPIRKIETPIKQGKGGSKTVGTEVQYFCTYAIEICEGPLNLETGIVIAKRDGKIVFDARPGSGMEADNQAFLSRCTIYLGTEDQLPDPSLEAIYGVGEVPAYRGVAYIVFRDDDLTARGGSLSQWEFVVGNGYVPPPTPDERLSRLVSVQAAIEYSGVQAQAAENWEDQSQSTWESYFSEFGDAAVVSFLSYTASSDPGDTGIAPTRTLPIDPTRQYWLSASLMFYIGDYVNFQFEFLDADGDTVCVVKLDESTIGTYQYRVQFGTSLGTLSYAGGTAGRSLGYFDFLDGVFRYTNESIAPSTSSFLLSCDALSIASVRISNCRARSTYVGSGAYAGVTLYRLPTGGEPPPPPEMPTGYAKLSDVVEDMHERCGADVPDVSAIDDIYIKGLVLASPDYSGANVIDMLRGAHFFDRVEVNGEIQYQLRGGASVATITEDDMVDTDESAEREAVNEFPRKVLLTAININANYETSTVPSLRYSPDIRVKGETSTQVPIVMDEQEQTTLVSILHKIAWMEAEGEVKFSLPMRWIRLTPGDCIQQTLRGQTRRVRIEEINDIDYVRSITGRLDRASAYQADPTYVPLPPPEPPISSVPGDTTLAVLDIPALVEQDDSLLYYVAVTGDRPAWTGSVVQRSFDDGANYNDVVPLGPSVLGLLLDPVSEASEFYTDTTNVVRVQLIRSGQEVDPSNETAFLADGGAFAIRKPDGSWEIMQYLDAVDEGNRIFALTTLHRGLRDTTPSEHLAGALFVLLDGVTSVPAQSAWLQTDLTHRAPSIGQSAEEADDQTQTFVGRSQIEWPVAFFEASIDTGTVTGSWVPRHRFGSDVSPLASVNFEGYRVTLDNGVDTVVLDVTDPNFTYDASAMSTPIDVTVQALNRITGPGEAVTLEVS